MRESVPVLLPVLPTHSIAMSNAPHDVSDEPSLILSLLLTLREALDSQDGTALAATRRTLSDTATPDAVMRVLGPLLFRSSSSSSSSSTGESSWSSQNALSVMGVLVSSDPSAYLKPISRVVKLETTRLVSTAEAMIVSPELLQIMVAQLSGDDVEVSVNATAALTAACKKLGPSFALQALDAIRTSWQSTWDQLASVNNNKKVAAASIIAVRCVSAMVEIAVAEDTFFKAAMESGAADAWTTMLQYMADPLLQMAILDLIEKLAGSRPMHATRTLWLFSNTELCETLLQMAGGSEVGVPDPLLVGSALRVVASMCKLLHHGDSSLSANHYLLTGFHHALHNWEPGGDVDRLAIVDAISSFASASEEALELVLEDPITRQAWLNLSVAQPKLKAAILVSIARVLDPDIAPQVDLNGDSIVTDSMRPSNTIGMELFAAVGKTNDQRDTTGFLLSMTRSPVPEIRIGCYSLLEAAAKLPTGGQVLFINGDFFTFVTARENETTKNGREAKYAIVQALLASPVKGLLAADIVRQLDKYVSQGPHYQKALDWEVATE
jgi:hypothetical protein